jgi:hypothetical protein
VVSAGAMDPASGHKRMPAPMIAATKPGLSWVAPRRLFLKVLTSS